MRGAAVAPQALRIHHRAALSTLFSHMRAASSCLPPLLAFSLFTQRANAMLLMNWTTPRALSRDCAANAKLAKLPICVAAAVERGGMIKF